MWWYREKKSHIFLPDLLGTSTDLGLRLWLLGGTSIQVTQASNPSFWIFWNPLQFLWLHNCLYFGKYWHLVSLVLLLFLYLYYLIMKFHIVLLSLFGDWKQYVSYLIIWVKQTPFIFVCILRISIFILVMFFRNGFMYFFSQTSK
jgi:hypothetical protein